MENQKEKSTTSAALMLPRVPVIPRRHRSKWFLRCRKHLAFDDVSSTPKRKSILFDADGTNIAKKPKKIKREGEYEGSAESKVNFNCVQINSRDSREEHKCTATSEGKDQLRVTNTCLPLLHKEVGPSSEQKGNSRQEESDVLSLWNQRNGRSLQEDQCRNKTVVLEPQTPLPGKEKHSSCRKISVGVKINQQKFGAEDKSHFVAEMASEAWYYTRSLNRLVQGQIESMEHQGATNHANQHQASSDRLKVHSKQVFLKGQKKWSKKLNRSSRDAKNALREWRKLLKKSDVKSLGVKLDDAEGFCSEDRPQCLHGRGLSFVHEVGCIQGSRVCLPWKGSVLDSVIGAFLTQRVSDNFSSSAFMSLGAFFPQRHNCGGYSRHHRMLREKRLNARRSPEKPAFGLISKFVDTRDNRSNLEKHTRTPFNEKGEETPNKGKVPRREKPIPDWSNLRMEYSGEEERERRSIVAMDFADWVAVSRANIEDISKAISLRGMKNKLAKRIKDFLSRLLLVHGNLDLEWMRNVPPQEAKEFLLSIKGIGLKSGDCVRLLTLKQPAFPVDVNVARVTVRLGWVPAPPIGDKLLMNVLKEYSQVHDWIHGYLWPCLCKLDQETLYQLHYQMITFGKVFCTKRKPNCGECPIRTQCKYYYNTVMRKSSTHFDKEDSDAVPAVNKEKASSVDNTRQCLRTISQLKTSKCSDFEYDMEDFFSVDQRRVGRIVAEPKSAPLEVRYQRNRCVVKDTEGFCPTYDVKAPETPVKDQALLNWRPRNKTNLKTASTRGRASSSRVRTEHSM